jgi:hypothetical protein
MTLNFYISYLVPVKPEKIQKIEQEISRILERSAESITMNALDEGPPFDRQEAELALTRLRAQMEPERRREPAVMIPVISSDARDVLRDWDCPRCYRNGLMHAVAGMRNGEVSMIPSCPECGAEVHKEELPMSLDLYRLRTRRTDGVEVHSKCI